MLKMVGMGGIGGAAERGRTWDGGVRVVWVCVRWVALGWVAPEWIRP